MTRRFNFKAAALIAVIHFTIGVLAVAMVGLGHNFWYWVAKVFTFPLKPWGGLMLGRLADHFAPHHALGEAIALAAMLIQSFCWGTLLGLTLFRHQVERNPK